MSATNLKNTIYKINIMGWEEYNGTLKKGHKCILLSTGFLTNAKVRSQTIAGRLLYLSCLLLAGESKRSQITVTHESLVFQSGVKSESLQSQLDRLQSFQLVTYEKIEPLLDRKGKERKRKDRIGGEANSQDPKSVIPISSRKPKASAPEGTHLAISRYCEVWMSRYGTRPPIGQKVAGQIKNLVKDHGLPQALRFIEAYLEMPDQWFVTKRHDIPTLLGNLNAITQFIDTGRMITKRDVVNLDSSNSLRNTLDAIERGEI